MASLKNYTNSIVPWLIADNTPHLIHLSSDSQRDSSPIGKYLPASVETKKTLNKNLRECPKLEASKDYLN